MVLSNAQVFTLTCAAVLLPFYAAVLSDFEVELIADVGSSFGRYLRDAVVTDTEWLVIDAAVAAMRCANTRAAGRERAA